MKRLAHDTGGAVMVMGVFMAVFMVGTLYYLIGLSQTMLGRELLQDSADYTAYSAAVMHARGMNLVALLNMIMAAVMAVLVALKIVEIVVTLAYAVAEILCLIPVTSAAGCPAETALDVIREGVSEAVRDAEPVVDEILLAGHSASSVVARGWPAISTATSMSGGLRNYDVDFVIALPTDLAGLPVEDESFDVLCARAGKYVGRLGTGAFDEVGLDAVTDVVSGVTARLVGAFPGYFCGGGVDTAEPLEIDLASTYSDEDVARECEDSGVNCPASLEIDPSMSSTVSQNQNEKTPKRVRSGVSLGGEMFQIRAVSRKDVDAEARVEGVAIAGMGRPSSSSAFVSAFSDLGKVGLAQSEFYYHASDSEGREEWLWHMNWRARMRRLHLGESNGALLQGCGEACGALGGLAFEALDGLAAH